MSDLAATNCGNGWGMNFGGGNNSCLWIILILLFCGGCGSGNNAGNWGGCGCANNRDNCGCC